MGKGNEFCKKERKENFLIFKRYQVSLSEPERCGEIRDILY